MAHITDPTSGEILGTEDAPECSRCAAYRQLAVNLEIDLKNIERDLRSLRRRATQAENELKRQLEEAPETKTVNNIFRYWLRVTGRDSKRYKLDEKRRKAVITRLRENRDESEIYKAIDGVMLSTWHRENGVTDLEFICRTAGSLEQFRDLAEAFERSSTSPDLAQ